jgi:carbon monoxide dehydrogenase subunit G
MHFAGQETIRVPIGTVWDFFMSPERVAECAPGFQSMEVLSLQHFKPKIGVGIGAVKATFTLDVVLADLRPPVHAEMKGHGVAGGSAVDLTGKVDLVAESDTATRMDWVADVNVSGVIANVGARLLESTARKMTIRFFGNVREKIEAPSPVSSG